MERDKQIEAYRTKVSDLIIKNINLRRDMDVCLKVARHNEEEHKKVTETLAATERFVKSQIDDYIKLLDEKYKLELEVLCMKEKQETSQPSR